MSVVPVMLKDMSVPELFTRVQKAPDCEEVNVGRATVVMALLVTR